MTPTGEVLAAAERALAFVTARSAGAPVDPDLRITMNFHPDRPVGELLVLQAMARDGVYRSQFETGTSNGGLTAHPGGDRWSWESRLFGGAYDHAVAADRPKYGSLNFRRRTVGGSPRFGSAHLRLSSDVLTRSTFCYPDSTFSPTHVGVASRLGLVELARVDNQDLLDDYIEAHVHGPVVLSRDVEAVVLDPCFRGTAVDVAAHRLGCPVEWHAGYRISADELRRHQEFRGPEYVELATSLTRDGHLDPALIGDAARSGDYDEQDLKRVWHLLARFGGPA